MRKIAIIALNLLILAACSKKSGTSPTTSTGDTTFNGSYVQLTIGSKYFYEKDASVPTVGHLVSISTSLSLPPGETAIVITDPIGIYGLSGIWSGNGSSSGLIVFNGLSTGTYQADTTYSVISQNNPQVLYLIKSGTVNVSYNGSDYIQGTINATLYANGFTYPTTGSFKIFH